MGIIWDSGDFNYQQEYISCEKAYTSEYH